MYQNEQMPLQEALAAYQAAAKDFEKHYGVKQAAFKAYEVSGGAKLQRQIQSVKGGIKKRLKQLFLLL